MKYFIFNLQIRLKTAFSARARKRRMDEFLGRMNIKGGEKIIDLGGTPAYWQNCPVPVEVWILNLPGENPSAPSETIHKIHMIEGDATQLAISRASVTISGIREATVTRTAAQVEDGKIRGWKVWLRVTFEIKDQLHE